jgi:hypothetical protein
MSCRAELSTPPCISREACASGPPGEPPRPRGVVQPRTPEPLIGLPNSATALRCKIATSRLSSFRANWIVNFATASRFVSSHSGPKVHIAASNATSRPAFLSAF